MNLSHMLILVIFNFYCFDCSPYYLNYLTKRGEKYCGSRLSSMLNLVCHGKYYAARNRRVPHNDIIPNFDSEYSIDIDPDYSNDLFYPFLQKDSALALLPNKVRRSHGIVTECCDNPCTVETIKEYCD